MKAHIELDIADVVQAIHEYVRARVDKVQVAGITVMSNSTIVMQTEEDMLVEPIRHRVHPERAKLPKDKTYNY